MAAGDKEYGVAATQSGLNTPSRSGHAARRSRLRPDCVRRRGLMNSPGWHRAGRGPGPRTRSAFEPDRAGDHRSTLAALPIDGFAEAVALQSGVVVRGEELHVRGGGGPDSTAAARSL
jgi:hypothetical protein